MELEEMQAVWTQMSDKIEKQKKLTDKMIIMMTQEKYKNRINRIAIPEILGAIICFGSAILILSNFDRLDTWYNLLSGIVSLLVLIILPVLSLSAINRMRNINIATNNYKETLLTYAKEKKRFENITKWGYYLGFILMFAILPVTTKILNNKDMFSGAKSFWPLAISIPVAIVFFMLFTRWVIKCYRNNINSAESLIKELEEIH